MNENEEIRKHYDGILPDDVMKEIDDRLKEIEVHQEKIISNCKTFLPNNLEYLNLA